MIEDGKVLYWGTSNWRAEHIFEAFALCEKLNLHKPIVGQNEYNLLKRNVIENQYESLFRKYNYSIVAWSPIAGGFLSGKYAEGIKEDELTRLTDSFYFPKEVMRSFFYDAYGGDTKKNAFAEFKKIAEELEMTQVQLALAWVINFPYTSSALIGSRNLEQLTSNLKAVELLDKLTPEVEARLSKLFGTNPEPKINFKKGWVPFSPIRP